MVGRNEEVMAEEKRREEKNIWSGMLRRNWCVSRGVRLVIYL